MAHHSHRAGGSRCGGRCSAYGRLELLSGRSVEARALDLFYPVLDRPTALHPDLQTAFHAAPAIPNRGSAKGTRQVLDCSDATGRTRRVPLQARSVRLADDETHAV